MKKYLLVIVLVAFFLGIYQLGSRDFWFDEAGSIFIAQDVLSYQNPPFYYLFLHNWIKLFGYSEFSLRLPSLFFFVFSVFLIFILGKKIFNYKVGLYSAVLMAFSPFQIWYAQEARPYTLTVLVGLLSSYFLYIICTENKIKGWCCFVLFSILGLYVSYFYIFMLIAQFIYLMIYCWKRRSFKEGFLLILIPLAFIPWASHFTNKLMWVKTGFWIPAPNLESFFITLENFFLGYNVSEVIYIISDILLFSLLAKAFWQVKKNKKSEQRFSFCFTLFLIPIVLVFVFSKIFFSIYLDRALILFSPYYYLIITFGLVSINNKKIKKALSLFIIGFLFYGLFSFYNDLMPTGVDHHVGVHLKKPIKPIVKYVKDNFKSKDKVAFTDVSIGLSYFFYSKEELAYAMERGFFLFDPAVEIGYFQSRGIPEHKCLVPIQDLDKIEFESLWVIYSSWARDGSLEKNSLSVREHLNKVLTLSLIKEFDGVWIYRYESNSKDNG